MPPEIETQISTENDAKAMRMAEVERKRAELRRRMEEASKARKAKKGFMTPERKKKLRLLLRKKAAEELKKEQERKAEERQWIIMDRCGDPDDLDWVSKDDLIDICEDYFQRILDCESEKWDIEYEIRKRAMEIAELNSKVNDLRGKFQKPILKKVSKYENKFAKLQRKAAEFNFRNQLKMVKRPDYTSKEGEEKKGLSDKHIDKEDVHEYEADKSIISEGDKSETERSEVDKLSLGGKEIEELAEAESGKLSQGLEEEINAEDAAVKEGAHRLEDDAPQDLEGEQVTGGQSPLVGEVQPAEPPPPSEPEHTEEDLWVYLKDSVTSVHPSTVEEFVQNLIGTLQHVPEEYLKPVIDANIKRATSPSVTDGEHLPTPEGVPLVEGEEVVTGTTLPEVTAPNTEDEVPLAIEADFTPTVEGQASAAAEEQYEVSAKEESSAFPEDAPVSGDPEDVGGFPASEED